MLFNTATRTKIGIALSEIANGVTSSFRKRNLLRIKLIAIPKIVPRHKPINALLPETAVASQIRVVLFKNCSMIFDGAAKKYGFKSKPLTAPSQSAKNTTPNTNGVAIFLTRSRVFIFGFFSTIFNATNCGACDMVCVRTAKSFTYRSNTFEKTISRSGQLASL
ncbi:unannotated protein [freshwater metagenome]|uniref:Unannotated protein n=1 Tax=freshwater metagenome TaxID=449393 RepID=A0A6J6B982_9ZZZZ